MKISLLPILKYNIFGDDSNDEVIYNGKCAFKCLEPNTLSISPAEFYSLPKPQMINTLNALLSVFANNEQIIWNEIKNYKINSIEEIVSTLKMVLTAISPFATLEGLVDPYNPSFKNVDLNSKEIQGFDLLWYFIRGLSYKYKDQIENAETVRDLLSLRDNMDEWERDRLVQIASGLGYNE